MPTLIDLNNIESNDNYELVIVEVDQIASDASNRIFALLVDDEERKCMIELNSYEASMLSFVMKDLHKNSHIQTIHQIMLRYINSQGVNIDKIVIESKVGDIIYATLTLVDQKHDRIFSIISLADAMILSLMSNRPLQAVSKVWDEMDEFDEWDYEYFTLDEDEDEED
jgi:bifunctional DNase/RNase